MTGTIVRTKRALMVGLALLVAVFTWLVGPSLSVRDARAIVGRPLTPMSYAGVARRTTRRTVAAGAVAHPTYVAPTVVVTPAPPVYTTTYPAPAAAPQGQPQTYVSSSW